MSFSGNEKYALFDGIPGSAQSPDAVGAQHLAYYKRTKADAMLAGMSLEEAHAYTLKEPGMYEPTDNKSKQSQAQRMQQAMAGQKFKYGGEILPAMPDYGYGY